MTPNFDLTRLYELVFLAWFVGPVSLTLTKAVIFRPVRKIIRNRAERVSSGFASYVGELVTCPYCTSHWIAFFTVLLWKPYFLVTHYGFLDFLSAWIALTALSCIVLGLVYRAIASV